MLDSVRVRLTLWYSIVLGLVLVLLAVSTFIVYRRSITQRRDSNLVELSNAFTATFNAELADQSGPGAVTGAVHEAMLEHRFRDTIFVFVGASGKILQTSLELPAAGQSREHVTPELFASEPFRVLAASG